ncbi:MAG: hypothetical protein IMZ64_14050 [Bacteroidetes bacterium]|nr:hypothetical protein [Bacteroidota bacterium]
MMRLTREIKLEKLLLLLFGSGSLVFLGVFYTHHLYQKEQLQLFEVTFMYFFQMISHQGGLSVYVGEFFIQFFHLPFAGAIIITILLLLFQKITARLLFKITGKSPLILFSFLPAIGYWILLLNDFYSLSGLAGLLISVTASCIYLNLKESGSRTISAMFLIPAVYWLTGGAYLVFALIIIVTEILLRFKREEKRAPVSLLVLLVYLLLTIFVPLIAREFIITDMILQSYLSESYYKIRIFFPLPLIVIFISFPLLILFQQFLPDNFSVKQLRTITIISLVLLLVLPVWGVVHFSDFKAEKEMAYENLVYKEEWGKIIDRAEKEQPFSPVSILAVNLALAETGQLSSKMFQFDQKKNSLFLEYERRGMTPFIANEPFYYLGLINFAQMFAMETIESTPDAKYPVRAFRRVAETFIINGQYANALKYLTPVSHTLFYRRWAKECMSYLYNEEKINTHPVWGSKRKLASRYNFYYNSKQIDIALRYLLISNPKNRMAFEYLMAYYLLQKNFDGFLGNIHLADEMNYNGLPVVWQQASAYIQTRLTQMPPQLEKFSVSDDVVNSIKSYAQLFSADVQDTVKIRKEFGKTYWYYLHFK